MINPDNNRLLFEPQKAQGIDPFSIAVTALLNVALSTSAASLGVGTLTAISQAVVAGAFIGGSLALSGAFSRGSGATASPSETQSSYDLEDGARIVVLGRARVGGVYGLRTSSGYDTYRLLYGCQGQIDGVEEYFASDRIVAVDPATGIVSSPPYAWGDGKHYMQLITKDGSVDQTSFDELLSQFPDDWTDDHRGRGMMATLGVFTSPGTTSSRYLKIWSSGFPEFDTLVRGPAIYDPRSGDSAWSDNGVLNVLALLTNSAAAGGWGLSLDRFNMTDIALEADKADAPVSSLSGSEVRSKCSGSYVMSSTRGAVLAEVLLSTGTQIVQLQDGSMSIRMVDDNPDPTTTIRRQDIQSVTWGGSELVNDTNRIALEYLSPERDWNLAEIEIDDFDWSYDQDSIDRTGEREETITLSFCPQSGQAQRIARRLFNRMRAMKGEVTTSVAGFGSFGHVNGTVELDELEEGYSSNAVLGSATMNFTDQTIKFPVTYLESELDEWDADLHEADAPEALEDIQFSGDIGTPSITAGSIKIVETETGNELRFQFEAPDDDDGIEGYEANYRTWTGSASNVEFGARLSMEENKTYMHAYSEDDVSIGDNFECQVRAYDSDYYVGNFSDEESVENADYDLSAPTGCTVTKVLQNPDDDPWDFGVQREYLITAVSTGINICKIGDTFVRPGEAVTFYRYISPDVSGSSGEEKYTWPNETPTGSVEFVGGSSSGGVTTIDY